MFKMTPVILKNLITQKATCRYPYEMRQPYDNVRGELVNNAESCIFCGVCAVKCPSQCITVDKKKNIWEYASSACVFCGTCVDSCPKQSLSQIQTYRKPSSEK